MLTYNTHDKKNNLAKVGQVTPLVVNLVNDQKELFGTVKSDNGMNIILLFKSQEQPGIHNVKPMGDMLREAQKMLGTEISEENIIVNDMSGNNMAHSVHLAIEYNAVRKKSLHLA